MVSNSKWTLSAAWQSFSISLVSFLSFFTVAISKFNHFLNPPSPSFWADEVTPTSQRIHKPPEWRTASSFSHQPIFLLESKTILSFPSPVTCLFLYLKVILQLALIPFYFLGIFFIYPHSSLYCSTVPLPAPSQWHWNLLRALLSKKKNFFFKESVLLSIPYYQISLLSSH